MNSYWVLCKKKKVETPTLLPKQWDFVLYKSRSVFQRQFGISRGQDVILPPFVNFLNFFPLSFSTIVQEFFRYIVISWSRESGSHFSWVELTRIPVWRMETVPCKPLDPLTLIQHKRKLTWSQCFVRSPRFFDYLLTYIKVTQESCILTVWLDPYTKQVKQMLTIGFIGTHVNHHLSFDPTPLRHCDTVGHNLLISQSSSPSEP